MNIADISEADMEAIIRVLMMRLGERKQTLLPRDLADAAGALKVSTVHTVFGPGICIELTEERGQK